MIKIIQTKKTTLSYGINDSATTLKLDNLLKLDGTSVSASDIGDELQGTFAPGTSREEIFLIDGANVTVNSDGTIEITNVLRGRKEVSPYGSGGYACDHGAGEIVIFGNNPQLYDKLAFKDNDETIAGEWTFTPLPRSDGGNATDGDQLVTYAQALAMATGTTSINRVVVAGNGGEVITAGQLLYLLVTDGEWYKCDADTAATVDNIILGIAQGAGTDGGAIANGVLLFGLDSNQTGLTTNTAYYAGNTAGSISSSVGTVEVSVGISRSTTSLLFYPRYNQQLTEDQLDLVEKIQLGTDFYGASSAGTDTYAITITPTVAYTNGIRFRFKTDVANTGAATLNVNGLGAITIKKAHDQDLATGDIEANQIVEVVYNSTGPVFEMISQTAVINTTDVQSFTANGTWTKPSGAKAVLVKMWGGGGAGGFGDGAGTGVGGGGGGGGSYKEWTFDASELSATEAVVVGAGGTGGAGNGPAGGNSSFGSTKVVAYGGGGGAGNASNGGGGGGAGVASAGTSATGATGGAGGNVAGGAGGSASVGGASLLGGGGGGAHGNTGYDAGLSAYGGGGGGGGSTNTGAPAANAGIGGSSIYGGGGGAGGPSQTPATVAGGTSTYGGAGGGSSYGLAGTAGGVRGGGGGAGSDGQNGGSGGRGEVIVITYL